MKFKGYSLKRALGALAFGVALLLGGSGMAYAQGHHQGGLGGHQRLERYYYGNSHALRDHQRRERHGYYNDPYYYGGRYNRGNYNYAPYNRGYFGNGIGFGFGHHRRHSW